MGFITSSSTQTSLQLRLTDEGRERILKGGNLLTLFSKFAISDGDIDYRSTLKHANTSNTDINSPQNGYIPDVSGNKTNFRNAINDGFKLKSIVWAKPQASLSVSSRPKKYVSIGFQETNGTVSYYKGTVEIDCYLNDYFILNKLLASRYIADHKDILSNAPTTIESSMDSYYKNVLNVNNDGEYLDFLNTLSEYGLGQYMEFFKSIKVYDGSSFHKGDFVMSSKKDYDYNNTLVLAGGAFVKKVGRGEHTGIDFSDIPGIRGLKQASPFSLMLEPKGGAGMIGFGAADIGYLNTGGLNTWNDTGEAYPTFKMNTSMNGWSTEVNNIKNILIGFVTSVDMETSEPLTEEGFGQAGYSNINTVTPTARLVLDVAASDLSPTYYPIKLSRLGKNYGDYVDINKGHEKGINITVPHPSATFGLFAGSLEYSSNWNTNVQGLKSSAPYFNIEPSKDGGLPINAMKVYNSSEPYYTKFTREAKLADNMFTSIASQNNDYWKTDTYNGGFAAGLSGNSVSGYNISIPITWRVQSLHHGDAVPCELTVRFKFFKGAITESIPYINSSGQNYYRLYDNNKHKFYGSVGETLSSFTEDPRGYGYTSGGTTNWQTSAGENLYRKLIRGEKII